MSAPNDLLNELRIDRKAPVTAPASNNTLRWVLISLVILSLLLAGYFMFGREKPVVVQTAIATSLANTGSGNASVLDASGYITARRIATVSSKITGKVKEVLIEEGQRVEEGQILATLEATDAVAQQNLSQSQLASTQSQLAEAQAQLKLAERNLARQRELATKKLVAASALDAAIAERDSRAARLVSLQRSVTVAQDQLHIANNGMDNTVIRAPFAGVIVTKAAQPGEMISPISAGGGSIRTGIGTLVDMDSLEVQVDVNESYIGRVQPKMPVEAVLNAYPEWKIPAEVIAIVPTADRSKATVKVRIALKSKDPRIVPDMGVRVSFLEGDKPAVVNAVAPKGVLIPETALVGDNAVFVINEGTAKRQSVQAGDKRGDQRVILSGLDVGDSVVISPPPDLLDGARVQSQ
ncbi:MAG: efflux RND transporter periplasmic adaptor subunit [Arenimonas sp.]